MGVTQRKTGAITPSKPSKDYSTGIPANVEKKKLPLYTWEQVREHVTDESMWIASKGYVYDITKFLHQHPGGAHALRTAAGQDVTWLLETSHPFTRKPWRMLEKMAVGRVEQFVTYREENPYWDECKAAVKNYFDTTGKDEKFWGPTLCVFLLLLSWYTVGMWGFWQGSVWACVLLGCTRALFGIHTMHSCSHFSVTHSPLVWKWGNWFVFDVLMGSSHWSWDYQHIIGHHQHTNVFKADPDLPAAETGDMRRVVDMQKWNFLYKFQALYLPILYWLLVLKVRVFDLQMILGLRKNGAIHMNENSASMNLFYATKMLWVFVTLIVPVFIFNMSWGLWFQCYMVQELFAGAWLAYFFQVNHLSDNLKFTDKDVTEGGEETNSTVSKEWAALQVEGSLDYGHDSFMHIFLSGTLNYQVIHHLFPSVSTHHYPAIAKLIIPISKKHNVRYQALPNYFSAAVNHVKELHRMGQVGVAGHF